MAPKNLDEFAGQAALLGPGKLLRRLVESGRFASALFFGPPGCGKTALARHIASKSNAEVVELNAVTAGVADIRKAVDQARYSAQSLGRKTLLLVDEIHHFNKTQQDALLPSVERGDV
ncbi:MAG: AAA family ATPase, partial [Elusimicrobia bacterium]|nr:AAA family ATPase [Elusimicrobiota bacterium]